MLHHISLGTANLARATAFYDAALAPLGYVRVWTYPDAVGYGIPGSGDKLAIKLRAGFFAPGLQRSREMTRACSPEMTHRERA